MIEQRRVQWLKGVTLILGLITLGVLVMRWTGRLSPVSPSADLTSTPTLSEDSGGLPNDRPTPVISEALELTGTPFGPSTPADGWANAVLDLALPLLQQPPLPTDGLAWWQGSGTSGLLTLVGGTGGARGTGGEPERYNGNRGSDT